jgi:hypothetical protein
MIRMLSRDNAVVFRFLASGRYILSDPDIRHWNVAILLLSGWCSCAGELLVTKDVLFKTQLRDT